MTTTFQEFKSHLKKINGLLSKTNKYIQDFENETKNDDIYGKEFLTNLLKDKELTLKCLAYYIYKPFFYRIDIQNLIIEKNELSHKRDILLLKRETQLKKFLVKIYTN